MKVLLVEDHIDTRKALAAFLQIRSAQVVEAGSVQEAIARLREGRFDAMLSDIGLPDGNGWDILDRERPLLFAISMSAHPRSEVENRCKEAGFQIHLEKPVSPDQLVEAFRGVKA